jgi:hypothetical protein
MPLTLRRRRSMSILMKIGFRTLPARRPWLLPVTVWMLLFAWRPMLFGLYHDDWALLLGCDGSILAELHCVDPSRPGAVLIRWAFHTVVGADPAAWQVITIATMLGAALTLMGVLRRVVRQMGYDDARAAAAAAVAASFYLAFPWMLGVAWVTATSPNIATILFGLAMWLWLTRWSLIARCVASAACFAAASLIYEAYWLAFVPFAALLWLERCLPRRDILGLTAALMAAQLILVAYNRLIAALAIGANKSIDPNWLHTLTGLWPTLIGGPRDLYGEPGRLLFVALLAAGLASLATRFDARRTFAVLGPVTMGIALSVTLFAIAGYVIRFTGLFARTTLVISWWLAVAVAIAAAAVPDLAPRPRMIARLAGLGLLVMLAGATLAQSREFITSWRQQRDMLASLPRSDLLAAPTGSLLVVEVPKRSDGVGTFNSWYDISAAIWTTAPDVARHLAGDAAISSPIAVPIPGNRLWLTRMTAGRVTQSSCDAGDPVIDLAARQVLLWRYPAQTTELISRPAEIGCGVDTAP